MNISIIYDNDTDKTYIVGKFNTLHDNPPSYLWELKACFLPGVERNIGLKRGSVYVDGVYSGPLSKVLQRCEERLVGTVDNSYDVSSDGEFVYVPLKERVFKVPIEDIGLKLKAYKIAYKYVVPDDSSVQGIYNVDD